MPPGCPDNPSSSRVPLWRGIIAVPLRPIDDPDQHIAEASRDRSDVRVKCLFLTADTACGHVTAMASFPGLQPWCVGT